MSEKYKRGDAPPVFRSTNSAIRKGMPVTSGVLNYFPDGLLCVALISRVGNDKHNPGEPLHWAKEKSGDEPDCEVRHMLDHLRGIAADPSLEVLPGTLGHLASKAWRALAHLQRACDAEVAAWEEAQKGTIETEGVGTIMWETIPDDRVRLGPTQAELENMPASELERHRVGQ